MSTNQNKYIVNFLLAIAILVIAFLSYKILSKPLNEIQNADIVALEIPSEGVLQESQEEFTKNVQNIVQQYILDNPNVILSSLETLQQKKFEEHKFNVAVKIKEKISDLSDTSVFPIFRKNDSNIKIFAFLDYNCVYCKKLNDSIKEVISRNPGLSVVYNLYPILGESSVYITKIMIALNKIAPESFKDTHDQIMGLKSISKQNIEEILEGRGIKLQVIEDEMTKAYMTNYLTKVSSLGKYLGISGVPVIIIGDQIYPGFMETEVLQDLITEQIKLKN